MHFSLKSGACAGSKRRVKELTPTPPAKLESGAASYQGRKGDFFEFGQRRHMTFGALEGSAKSIAKEPQQPCLKGWEAEYTLWRHRGGGG